MSIPMKARRAFRYAGRALSAGDPFDALTEVHALAFTANGNARRRAPEAAAAPPRAAAPQTYRTRMMTAESPGLVIAPPIVTKTDALDGMDADALHALAGRRGVYVHHRAGADKVRQALREASQEPSPE